ncbi:hypothetical protein V6N12_007005 [Hibiscus sabdariffa]|uniref:B box-type domain-containing protein n=1 Tax=Hibiscus sabdariffa TaxID=183260 RepID=A0ABR2F0F8_9ROSI
MEPLCDFCRGERAVVYCKSDSARLCLSCDGCVHSANLLSRRHARSLLCEKCNYQSAVVRCLDEKLSLCQDCDRNGNGCSSLGHCREALNSYTDCPSLAEFRRIWSSVLGVSSPAVVDVDQLLGASPANNCLNQTEQGGSFELAGTKLKELDSCSKMKPCMELTSLISPDANYVPYCRDGEPLLSGELSMPNGYSDLRDCKVPDGDGLCEGLNTSDVQLSFETDDEIFGCSQGQTRYQFEKIGTDCLIMDKTLSVTESNGPIGNILEASPLGQKECLPSTVALPLSNFTGKNSPADYKDSGLSPAFLTGDSPWESNSEASCPQARDKAKKRYNEKKKTRVYVSHLCYLESNVLPSVFIFATHSHGQSDI